MSTQVPLTVSDRVDRRAISVRAKIALVCIAFCTVLGIVEAVVVALSSSSNSTGADAARKLLTRILDGGGALAGAAVWASNDTTSSPR
jgi:hypothetical protein